MKYFKRLKIYKASNVTFDPVTKDAFSYGWWRFVAVVEGKLIFNSFRYSNSTSKHQHKVGRVLDALGIKIDITMPLPRGIRHDQSLAELIVECEEHLCDAFLAEELKKQERNARVALRRRTKKLEDYLENQCAFRDYSIFPADQFGKRTDIAHHQLVDMSSMESDVSNALHSFNRDGFGQVIFYV